MREALMWFDVTNEYWIRHFAEDPEGVVPPDISALAQALLLPRQPGLRSWLRRAKLRRQLREGVCKLVFGNDDDS